jgi:hypothetical protein
MKGTRNRAFIVRLNGRSVLATSQAKNTPTVVATRVVPPAMMKEFNKAGYVSGSLRTCKKAGIFNFPSSKKAVMNIRITGIPTTTSKIKIENIRTTSAVVIFRFCFNSGMSFLQRVPEKPCKICSTHFSFIEN